MKEQEATQNSFWVTLTAYRTGRKRGFHYRVKAIFPGLSSARAGMREARFHWPSHPWTLGSYACFRPGQWTTLRGAIGERVGNLHFAGEHCAFDNQGFMEGGVESGEWVAQVLLEASRARHAA